VSKTQQEEANKTVQKESTTVIGSGEEQTVSNRADGTGERSNELVYVGSMELRSENFSVDYYEGGYTLLKITDGTRIFGSTRR